ncbi:MAG: hypothetical protein RLZZ483_91 [Actinomycetota bacterium]
MEPTKVANEKPRATCLARVAFADGNKKTTMDPTSGISINVVSNMIKASLVEV